MPSLSCPSHLQGRHPPPHAAPSLSAKSLFFFFSPKRILLEGHSSDGANRCSVCMYQLHELFDACRSSARGLEPSCAKGCTSSEEKAYPEDIGASLAVFLDSSLRAFLLP